MWRSTCERYSKIHVPYKYKTIIESLLKNQSICIMKKDKGRGVAVMDGSKYTEKCLSILQTEQFTKQRHEKKLQKTYLTVYNLLIEQDLWQGHYQILLINLMKQFIKLNINTYVTIKILKSMELNTKTGSTFLNTQAL